MKTAPFFVVRGSWFVVRGSWFVVRGSWFVVRGSWLVALLIGELSAKLTERLLFQHVVRSLQSLPRASLYRCDASGISTNSVLQTIK